MAVFARGETVIPSCTPSALKKVAYSVTARVIFGKKARGDADNVGKVVCDGLVDARVIHSDDRVMEFHVYKDLDERPDDSRTEITISAL